MTTEEMKALKERFGPERAARAAKEPAYCEQLTRQLRIEASNQERWRTDDRYRQQIIADEMGAALDDDEV